MVQFINTHSLPSPQSVPAAPNESDEKLDEQIKQLEDQIMTKPESIIVPAAEVPKIVEQ